jgi:hypothetical protein
MRKFTAHRRDSIVHLYRLILDRDPESDQVVDEKRRGGRLSEIAIAMLVSDEFVSANESAIRDFLSL